MDLHDVIMLISIIVIVGCVIAFFQNNYTIIKRETKHDSQGLETTLRSLQLSPPTYVIREIKIYNPYNFKKFN
jgi:hypothetical protein